MFGHLKPEEFVNVIDGLSGPAERERLETHLMACRSCAETLEAMSALQARMIEDASGQNAVVPEPDWSEFREGVRNSLLSRSVQRESAHSWLKWPVSSWRPVLAWGMSAAFVVALTTGALVWNGGSGSLETAPPDEPEMEVELAEWIDWSGTDVLHEIAGLNHEEAENLELMLRDALAEFDTAGAKPEEVK
jgi:hypothetical protein